MKKIVLISLLLSFLLITIHAQDVKDADTKMEQFSSKTGSIVKFMDFKLPNLKHSHNSAIHVNIRIIISDSLTGHFLQISKRGDYGTTASIAYEDLIEVIKALKTLKQESNEDLILNPDYLENVFVTDDGFEIGYFITISKKKVGWFLKLTNYGSNNKLYFKDVESIETFLNSAQSKIEELKLGE